MNDLLHWFITDAVIYLSRSFLDSFRRSVLVQKTTCVRISGRNLTLRTSYGWALQDRPPGTAWSPTCSLLEYTSLFEGHIASFWAWCTSIVEWFVIPEHLQGSSHRCVRAFQQVRSDAVFEERWEVACFYTCKLNISEIILFSEPADCVTLLGKEALQELISQGIRD